MHDTCVCCCPQAYDEVGGRVRLVSRMVPCFPVAELWQHLACTPSLPWSLDLRVEVDGVLEEEVHEAEMQVYASGGAYIKCDAAFRPLMGKRHVAWRFMQPDTLVFAVRTAGCSAAEGGPAATATSLGASAHEEEEEEEEVVGEEGGEEEEEEGVCRRVMTKQPVRLRPPPPCPRKRGAHASGSIQTIRVSAPPRHASPCSFGALSHCSPPPTHTHPS